MTGFFIASAVVVGGRIISEFSSPLSLVYRFSSLRVTVLAVGRADLGVRCVGTNLRTVGGCGVKRVEGYIVRGNPVTRFDSGVVNVFSSVV